ncbi:MAG: hypothetical protein LBP92_13265, partial [Deltaproteobacteria bacterium]|nr:hypothetical protein [Deltaproteobacteria bacterium]
MDWRCLRDNLRQTEPSSGALPVEAVLDASGLLDALWVMGAVAGRRGAMRLFACRLAEKALLLLERPFPDGVAFLRERLEVASRMVRGAVSEEQMAAARDEVFAFLSPAPGVKVLEHGGTSWPGKIFHEMFKRDADLDLEAAGLAVAAALRKDIAGGMWMAADHVIRAVSSRARSVLREVHVVKGETPSQDSLAQTVAAAASGAVGTLAGKVDAALRAKTGLAPGVGELSRRAL